MVVSKWFDGTIGRYWREVWSQARRPICCIYNLQLLAHGSTPRDGPQEDGPGAQRWDNDILRAFYNGWKSIHGLKSNREQCSWVHYRRLRTIHYAVGSHPTLKAWIVLCQNIICSCPFFDEIFIKSTTICNACHLRVRAFWRLKCCDRPQNYYGSARTWRSRIYNIETIFE